MRFTIEELHVIRIAIENLEGHDKEMVEIGKQLQDEEGQKIYEDEIKKIENIKIKLHEMIEKYYD